MLETHNAKSAGTPVFVNLAFYESLDLVRYESLLFREHFEKNNTEFLYTEEISRLVRSSVHEMIQHLVKELSNISNDTVRSVSLCETAIRISVSDKIVLFVYHTHKNIWEVDNISFSFRYSANPENAKKIHDILERIEEVKYPVVSWRYMNGNKMEKSDIPLVVKPKPIYKEFYPWLNCSPKEYFDNFMKSDCNLLILRGQPGTGKTSFIRNFLWVNNKKSMITYEEELFKSDNLFVEFLSGDINLLIMEDADSLLTDRQRTGNNVMSKFLNVSDGLIDIPNKKMIITANVIDKNDIDDALLRPGRCFDSPVFRKLTYEETLAACHVAKIKAPETPEEYSLAEIFSNANDSINKKQETKIIKFGFAG